MKNIYFFLFAIILSLTDYAYGFDLKGIQPLAPDGVFSTFSAASLKQGAIAAALGMEKSEHPGFYRLTAQFAYGLSDKIELISTVPYISDWQGTADGFEDIAIGVKHRFLDEGYYGPSAAYLLTASFPTGMKSASSEGSFGGGLIISKKVGPVKGHANLFYSRPGTPNLDDDITFAAGLDFSASHNFKLLGELYGKKSYSGSLDRLEFRFGYRVVAPENFITTVGVGFDVKKRSPEYRLLLNMTYMFPSDAGKIRKIYESED